MQDLCNKAESEPNLLLDGDDTSSKLNGDVCDGNSEHIQV